MRRLLILCVALTFAVCATAHASSFSDLMGLQPTPEPDAPSYAIPDMAFVMEAVPQINDDDFAIDSYRGLRYRFDYRQTDKALERSEAFFNAMTELGYAAESVTVQKYYKSILFTQGDARVLLVPVADRGHVSIVLCEGANYRIVVKWETEPETVPLPILDEVMGTPGKAAESVDTPWDFSMHLYLYSYASAREMVAAVNALKVQLDMLGYTPLEGRIEDEWCVVYKLNGAHVMVLPDQDNAVCGIGLEIGEPFRPMPGAESAKSVSEPTVAPTAAPTAVPVSEAVLPDFGAFIGWTPTESRVFYTQSADGTRYCYDVYYGYVESVVREYVELLKDPRFGLAIRDENVVTQTEDGMLLESTFACRNSSGFGSGLPGIPGSRVDILLTSVTNQNVMLLLLYPEAMRTADAGVRSSMYGKIAQGAPVQNDAGGEQSGSAADSVCALCHGTGVCYYCGGAGYTYTYTGKQTCPSCNRASGVCKWCNGTGIH